MTNTDYNAKSIIITKIHIKKQETWKYLVCAYLPSYAQRSSHISKKYVRELKKYRQAK